jgi:hypothetical protein
MRRNCLFVTHFSTTPRCTRRRHALPPATGAKGSRPRASRRVDHHP